MIRSLIRLAILLGIVALIYYRFFGDEAEQAKSKEVITTGKEVAKNLGELTLSLIKKGQENLESGKYDDALADISNLIDKLKEKAETLEEGKEIYDQIRALEDRRTEIEQDLAAANVSSYDDTGENQDNDQQKAEIKQSTKDLLNDTENLLRKLENQ